MLTFVFYDVDIMIDAIFLFNRMSLILSFSPASSLLDMGHALLAGRPHKCYYVLLSVTRGV